MSWWRKEQKIETPKQDRCKNIEYYTRMYLEQKEKSSISLTRWAELKKPKTLRCNDIQEYETEVLQVETENTVASYQWTTASTMLQNLIPYNVTVRVKMDGKAYDVSHKDGVLGRIIDVVEVHDPSS